MKVWVDCTAAAHPLVLRPMIERLEARGTRSFVTAREYGQTVGMLERLGIPYTSVGEPRRRLDARQGAGAGRPLARGWRGWSGTRRPDLAIAHGSVDLAVVSALFRIPSVQMQDYEFAGLQRQIAFRVARRVLVPDAIPVDAAAADRRRRGQAGPLPGPEGGLLPGRLRARPGRPRRARPRPREGRWSSSARRRRPPSTTPATTSTARRSGASPGDAPGRRPWSSRAPRRRARGAGARRRQPGRPRAGDRRAEPDRLRRPRRQRRRDDEPRGGRARHARLHDLHRPDGRRRRGS